MARSSSSILWPRFVPVLVFKVSQFEEETLWTAYVLFRTLSTLDILSAKAVVVDNEIGVRSLHGLVKFIPGVKNEVSSGSCSTA